jgi:methylated-DNA-[protein]-cysteine S-methyltransferase
MDGDNQRLVVFETDVGWCGLLHEDRVLQRVRIGYSDQLEAALAFQEHKVGPSDPNGWEKKLIKRMTKSLSRPAKGKSSNRKSSKGKSLPSKAGSDFSDIEIDESDLTPFQKKVTDACRQLGFGATASYGELAERVGHPGAARAVGSVMSRNRFPIIVPCHRVLSSGGLGGYSSPRGLSTKQELLEIEGHEFV